jgi:hypothetical protein
MLSYAFRAAMSLIQSWDYRALSTPDYLLMCQCLILLDEPLSVADVMEKLSAGTSADSLMAYQIAFDMYESATQQFLSRVLAANRKTAPAVTTNDATTTEESRDNLYWLSRATNWAKLSTTATLGVIHRGHEK